MDERVKAIDEKMTKAYDYLVSDLATIRAGRANPHVLDKVELIITVHQHLFSRLVTYQYLNQECFR